MTTSTDWLDINLPWYISSYITQAQLEPFPDYSNQLKELFGYSSRDDLLNNLIPNFSFDNPIWSEHREIEGEILRKHPNISKEELHKQLIALNNPAVNIVEKYRRITREMDDWVSSQPEYIAITERNQQKRDQYKEQSNQLSFCGRKLNKPGTLIEFEENGQLVVNLIGDINVHGGYCNDCAIESETIILRYKGVCSNSEV